MRTYSREVTAGERFEFGKNWQRFLSILNEDRIALAEESLQQMLRMPRLDGKLFLDAGSGSGLFSLAATRLGARVRSFDYDPHSVACTRWLKERYAPQAEWTIEEASVLDKGYLERLGQFDVVYSWGVLHHTGAMWEALENVANLVKEGGQLFIAIYNDQGSVSRRWRLIKRLYNKSPKVLKPFVLLPTIILCEARLMPGRILRGKNPFSAWFQRTTLRGMNKWHNWIDWIGGYPFEVAKPEAIFEFYSARGFSLSKMTTQGGSLGCNEFVFTREPLHASSHQAVRPQAAAPGLHQ